MTGWFGGVGYRLLPVITGLAFSACVSLPTLAAEINISNLRGYSIEAEWMYNGRVTLVEKYGKRKRFNEISHHNEKVYISKTGRMFHRQHWNGGSRRYRGISDSIRSGRGENFKWDSNSTLVFRSYGANEKQRTTYVRIIRITLSQSGGSYSCSVKVSRALQKGEKQYIKYDLTGRDYHYKIYHSFKARQKSCRVFKGNVFKGEVGP